MRGNVVELAIAVVIGAAFAAVVSDVRRRDHHAARQRRRRRRTSTASASRSAHGRRAHGSAGRARKSTFINISAIINAIIVVRHHRGGRLLRLRVPLNKIQERRAREGRQGRARPGAQVRGHHPARADPRPALAADGTTRRRDATPQTAAPTRRRRLTRGAAGVRGGTTRRRARRGSSPQPASRSSRVTSRQHRLVVVGVARRAAAGGARGRAVGHGKLTHSSRAVGEHLPLPDRQPRLRPRRPAGAHSVERLAAVRRGHGGHQRDVADASTPDPVAHGHGEHVRLGGELGRRSRRAPPRRWDAPGTRARRPRGRDRGRGRRRRTPPVRRRAG